MSLSQQIIISIITVLISAIISSMLSVKTSKRLQDRTKLQEIYKEIYLYLDEMNKLFDGWKTHDFKYQFVFVSKNDKNRLGIIRRYKNTGDIIYIDKGIQKKILSVENIISKYKQKVGELERDIFYKLYESDLPFVYNNSDEDIIDNIRTYCNGMMSINALSLLNYDAIIRILEDVSKDNRMYSEINIDYKRIIIYNEKDEIGNDDIANSIIRLLYSETVQYDRVTNDFIKEMKKLPELIKTVEKRAKEPIGLL